MRSKRLQCRPVKRCILFFTAITILPLALVYLATSNEQFYRIRSPITENGNSTQFMSEELPRALSQSEVEMIEARMAQRNERLAEKCAELGLDVHGNDSWHQPNPWEFLVNRKYHIIWCNVFKSASTSWMYNFNILAGYSPEFLKKSNAVPLELARKKYPRVTQAELEKAQNDSTTFLIVRHPFERLLSAYKDKLLYAVPHSLHDKLGHKIIRRYRKRKKNVIYPKHPTFFEFISFILDEVKKKNALDMHWTPITKFCSPCQVKFDIVAKFETLDEDQRYLIAKANLNNIIKPEWKNYGKGRNTQDLVTKYYSQLTREQLDGIFEFFRYDFELFDYSSDEYFKLDLATNEPSNEYKDKSN